MNKNEIMSSDRFRAICKRMKERGICSKEFGWALGYGGSDSSIRTQIYRMKAGGKKITTTVAILAIAYDNGLRLASWPPTGPLTASDLQFTKPRD